MKRLAARLGYCLARNTDEWPSGPHNWGVRMWRWGAIPDRGPYG